MGSTQSAQFDDDNQGRGCELGGLRGGVLADYETIYNYFDEDGKGDEGEITLHFHDQCSAGMNSAPQNSKQAKSRYFNYLAKFYSLFQSLHFSNHMALYAHITNQML